MEENEIGRDLKNVKKMEFQKMEEYEMEGTCIKRNQVEEIGRKWSWKEPAKINQKLDRRKWN